jgi:CubicO group peptidase (beta-lactamase class C family)
MPRKRSPTHRFALGWAIGVVMIATTADAGSEYPGIRWTNSTPTAEGVDIGVLAALDEEFTSGAHGYINGMLVIRNGRIVYQNTYAQDYDTPFKGRDQARGQYNYYDPDWHPYFERGPLHTVQSISKSVTSALIGIAIGRGEIPGVEVDVMRYFDDHDQANPDARWSDITLRDLLTMTSGIDWDESSFEYTDPRNVCAAMESSADWVAYVLNRSMAATPGEKFVYNSGVTMLLSHILLRATGKQADAYAREHLFGPLGIGSFYWKRTPTGLIDAEGGLYLKPEDLARFGLLYAHDGMWDEKRILPANWVSATMAPSIAVPDAESWKYGFQWWLMRYTEAPEKYAYTGLGYGGQRLIVLPEYDLVAVFTGWNIYDKPSLSADLLLDRLLKSVRK